MKYPIKEEGNFKYLETGNGTDGEILMLLHGLFGAMSNFDGIINHFAKKTNVVVPILPIMEMPLRKLSVGGLVKHVEEFVAFKGFEKVHALGNSLGGHVALLYALADPEKVRTITLTGSSGLFESAMGSSFPKRGDYKYIQDKTGSVFFDKSFASKELVDEVYDAVNDRGKAIRLVVTAKSAVRQNLADKLGDIKAPGLLVWGKNDEITPPFVAEKFHELLPNSRLIFIDKCGHAPMMEHPAEFNKILEDFLAEHSAKVVA